MTKRIGLGAGLLDIYCINLDARPERWERMQSVAADVAVALKRVQAVGPDDVARMLASGDPSDSVACGPLTPQQTGCALSHLKCWRAFLASGAEAVVILEDDVILADGFAQLVTGARWPEDAGLIRIEATAPFASLDRIEELDGAGRRIGRLLSAQSGTGGYVLFREAAEHLVAVTTGFEVPVDLYLFDPRLDRFPDLVRYQVYPAPVQQGSMTLAHAQADWAQSSIAPDFVRQLPEEHEVLGAPGARATMKSLGSWMRAIVRRLRGRNKVRVRFG